MSFKRTLLTKVNSSLVLPSMNVTSKENRILVINLVFKEVDIQRLRTEFKDISVDFIPNNYIVLIYSDFTMQYFRK